MTQPGDDSLELVRQSFSNLWPVHLSSFNKLLIQLRKTFDGDLDLMLVMAVIGDRTRPDTWLPEPISYRQITRRKGEEHLQVPINIQSVADYAGIPRETVRRKVQTLQKKGWVDRNADGLLTISATAAADLEQSTSYSIQYLAAISSAILGKNNKNK